jgi:hypothetical protein
MLKISTLGLVFSRLKKKGAVSSSSSSQIKKARA